MIKDGLTDSAAIKVALQVVRLTLPGGRQRVWLLSRTSITLLTQLHAEQSRIGPEPPVATLQNQIRHLRNAAVSGALL